MSTRIVKNIKALRAFLQLTQAQFADAIGVSEGLISMLERAEREPSAGFVARICQTFHVRPNTLYDRDMVQDMIESIGEKSPEEASENA